MAAAKRPRTRARKRQPAKPAQPLVEFSVRIVENERAGLRCSCTFADHCDGSRLIHCSGNTVVGLTEPGAEMCECAACPPQLGAHVTGCQGCEQCNRAECGTCGKRGEQPAEPDSIWYCSPECSRKAFTVAS